MHLQFIGAVGTVTGSKTLLVSDHDKYLVDCGLFQGYKTLRLRNWAPLPFDPSELKSVFITHAHIDHSGYLPLLVKNGFRGKIYCSYGTEQLCRILLLDSGYLQEEDARYANRHGFSKHKPALPLYTREDAERSLEYFQSVDFRKPLEFPNGLEATFYPAGHILGASLVYFKKGNKTILFTGDLGRPQDLIMNPPAHISEVDTLVIESTYGNKLHQPLDPKEEIRKVIKRTARRGGVIVIPSFAVGRAQTMLYILEQLKLEKKIPDIPIFLDSPMASDVTETYCKLTDEHRLSNDECRKMCRIAKFINTPEQSKALDVDGQPKVIITASGMATGGRVVHHLKTFVTDPRNTILFVGFQAPGTRGDALVNGVDRIKIHGEYFPVRAEVVLQDTLSAHADYNEILDWLKHFKSPPKNTYLLHGELSQSEALRMRIQDDLGWACSIPDYLEKVEI